MHLNRAIIHLIGVGTFLLLLLSVGYYATQQEIMINLFAKRQPPDMTFWFGTDNLGQDVWLLCLQGMMASIQIGCIAAGLSSILALLFAGISLLGKWGELSIRMVIDMFLTLPHLLLLLILCFTFGGGQWGIIAAVSLTHWPKLTLILCGELQRIRHADYLLLAQKMGLSHTQQFYKHYLPLLLPQLAIGALLIFPHAILHSASLSFLGFGASAHEPSLGLLLAEALRYISSGDWWLVFFPGLTLVILVLTFDRLVRSLQKLWLRGPLCCS